MTTNETTQMQLPAARCDRLLYLRVQQRATHEGHSVSRIIRDALEEYCREGDPEYQKAIGGGEG